MTNVANIFQGFFFFAISYQLCTTWLVPRALVLFLRLTRRWPLMTYLISSWTIQDQRAIVDHPTDVLLLHHFMHAKQMSLLKSTKFKIYFLSILTNLSIIQVFRFATSISGENKRKYLLFPTIEVEHLESIMLRVLFYQILPPSG